VETGVLLPHNALYPGKRYELTDYSSFDEVQESTRPQLVSLFCKFEKWFSERTGLGPSFLVLKTIASVIHVVLKDAHETFFTLMKSWVVSPLMLLYTQFMNYIA